MALLRRQVLRNMLVAHAITRVEFDNAMHAPRRHVRQVQQRSRTVLRGKWSVCTSTRSTARMPYGADSGLHDPRHGHAAAGRALTEKQLESLENDMKLTQRRGTFAAATPARMGERRTCSPRSSRSTPDGCHPFAGRRARLEPSNFNRATRAKRPGSAFSPSSTPPRWTTAAKPTDIIVDDPFRSPAETVRPQPAELRSRIAAGDAPLRAAAVDQRSGDQAAAQGGRLSWRLTRGAWASKARPEPLARARQQKSRCSN